jgi:hypothetical protein
MCSLLKNVSAKGLRFGKSARASAASHIRLKVWLKFLATAYANTSNGQREPDFLKPLDRALMRR